MQRKLRVGAVSYLNTKPLIYEFQRGAMADKIDLIIDHPSRLAQMLISDEIDVGLVPVAIIPELEEYYLVSDFCIGCNGEVASVCLFSEVPMQEVKTVLLDYQSRTSSALLAILMKEYWKINVAVQHTSGEYQHKIKGTTAGLVIGDRALKQRLVSPYIYDLGLAWKEFTGLPFVFATWISKGKIQPGFKTEFNAANELGLTSIPKIVDVEQYEVYDLLKYYQENLSYTLDTEKMKGLTYFLTLLDDKAILTH